MSTGKWQKEAPFVDWLLASKYSTKTKKGIEPIIGLGLVLYCFEAYCIGKGQK